MISTVASITERIELSYEGTLDSITEPDLYVNGVLSAVAVTADTSVAGKVVLTHTTTGRSVGDILDYRGGELEIDGETYPLVVQPRRVEVAIAAGAIPNAVAGAAGGLLVAGSNAATTFHTVTISTGGFLVLGGINVLTGGMAVSGGANLGTVTATLSGNVSGTVGGIVNGGITRASFAADTGLVTIRSNSAQAGAASSITLDASASSTDNDQQYVGNRILITSGFGIGEAATITAYNGTTKVATVNRAWTVQPQSGSTFAILPASDTSGVISLLSRIPVALFSGITSVGNWLRALLRSSTPDATALSEINTGGGTYDATTDALEANTAGAFAAALSGARVAIYSPASESTLDLYDGDSYENGDSRAIAITKAGANETHWPATLTTVHFWCRATAKLLEEDSAAVPMRPILTISTLTHSSLTATATTSTAHGLSTGDVVWISGATEQEWGGYYSVTVTSTTTFTCTLVSTPSSTTATAGSAGIKCQGGIACTVTQATGDAQALRFEPSALQLRQLSAAIVPGYTFAFVGNAAGGEGKTLRSGTLKVRPGPWGA